MYICIHMGCIYIHTNTYIFVMYVHIYVHMYIYVEFFTRKRPIQSFFKRKETYPAVF